MVLGRRTFTDQECHPGGLPHSTVVLLFQIFLFLSESVPQSPPPPPPPPTLFLCVSLSVYLSFSLSAHVWLFLTPVGCCGMQGLSLGCDQSARQ